ncbi:MAG: GAF domain-containing protein [Desulfobacterales bacterium]|nr:GAF domain-containing protein [Desulfobacterales bacterium]
MKQPSRNYETMIKVAQAISATRDPEEICLVTVESIKTALDVKGCTLFLINRKTSELEIAASFGLSHEYLKKGPVSALRSIAESFKEGPIAIYDVSDDPRIQYPDAAVREGIASIMTAPIIIHDNVIGALRVYTAEPWEFGMDDVSFVQAVAQMAGMAIDLCRISRGLKNSIEILKTMRDPKWMKAAAPAPSPA